MQMCPHCGFNLAAAQPLEFGNIAFDARYGVRFRGASLTLPRSLYDIVETLVRARGTGVTVSVLASRVQGDIDDATIVKYIERARSRFRRVDPRFDQIVSLRGFAAYRWAYRDREHANGASPQVHYELAPSQQVAVG